MGQRVLEARSRVLDLLSLEERSRAEAKEEDVEGEGHEDRDSDRYEDLSPRESHVR